MTYTNYSTYGVVNSIVNEPLNGNYLRICSWNIEGLFKYRNDCDFISFVKLFIVVHSMKHGEKLNLSLITSFKGTQTLVRHANVRTI